MTTKIEYSTIVLNRKIESVLQNMLPISIAQHNASQSASSLDLPLFPNITVGAPIIDWENVDNTTDSTPLVLVTHSNSNFFYRDALCKREEEAYYRLMVLIPDSDVGIPGSLDQASILARIALDLIEAYCVDSADDPNGTCFKIDLVNSQAPLLSKGHGVIYTLQFKAYMRSNYKFLPWEAENSQNYRPPYANYNRQTEITYSFEDDVETTVETNSILTIETSLSSILITPIKIYENNITIYAVSADTRLELATSSIGGVTNIAIGSLQTIWDSLNSGEYITVLVTCWRNSDNYMWFIPIRIKKLN